MAKITTKQHLNNLRHKTVAELLGANENSRAELFALKFQAAMGSLEKTHRISQLKKEIARIELILGEKRRAGENVSQVVKADYSKAVTLANKAGKILRKKQLDKLAALNSEPSSEESSELNVSPTPEVVSHDAPSSSDAQPIKARRKVKRESE